MERASAGELLRDARLRHGLNQEDLAVRAGTSRTSISEIETGSVSPSVAVLSDLLELVGEALVCRAEARDTGVDITLNQSNLELSPEERVVRGLAFADVVRQNRPGGSEDLGRSLRPGPILRALGCEEVNFVVIGSIAGLVHGSAYPTYDLDVIYDTSNENLKRLSTALGDLGLEVDRRLLMGSDVLSFATEFGTLDILRKVHGVRAYSQLLRESSRHLVAGIEVQVASLNHLIAMKRASGRVKDQLMVLEYVEFADEIRRRENEEGR